MAENIDPEDPDEEPWPPGPEQIVEYLRAFRDLPDTEHVLAVMKAISEKLSLVHLYKENMQRATQMPQPYGNIVFNRYAILIREQLTFLHDLPLPRALRRAPRMDVLGEPLRNIFREVGVLEPHMEATIIVLYSQQVYQRHKEEIDEAIRNPQMERLIDVAFEAPAIEAAVLEQFERVRRLMNQAIREGNQIQNRFFDDGENAEPAVDA